MWHPILGDVEVGTYSTCLLAMERRGNGAIAQLSTGEFVAVSGVTYKMGHGMTLAARDYRVVRMYRTNCAYETNACRRGHHTAALRQDSGGDRRSAVSSRPPHGDSDGP